MSKLDRDRARFKAHIAGRTISPRLTLSPMDEMLEKTRQAMNATRVRLVEHNEPFGKGDDMDKPVEKRAQTYLTESQDDALTLALEAAGVNKAQAIREALALWCKLHGVEFDPNEVKHGGYRQESKNPENI